MEMTKLSCEKFLAELASKAPRRAAAERRRWWVQPV